MNVSVDYLLEDDSREPSRSTWPSQAPETWLLHEDPSASVVTRAGQVIFTYVNRGTRWQTRCMFIPQEGRPAIHGIETARLNGTVTCNPTLNFLSRNKSNKLIDASEKTHDSLLNRKIVLEHVIIRSSIIPPSLYSSLIQQSLQPPQHEHFSQASPPQRSNIISCENDHHRPTTLGNKRYRRCRLSNSSLTSFSHVRNTAGESAS